MLTSIDLDSSYSLKFGQEPQIQRNVPNLETPSRNSTKPQQTEVSEALQNNNYQEDYVKMSAKLVWMPKSTLCCRRYETAEKLKFSIM